MEEKNLFAENLKFLRSKNGMEQLDLAKRLGRKSSSSISEWEKGKYTPKAGVLNDIARIFNVSLSELMSTDIANPENTTSEPTIVKGFNIEELASEAMFFDGKPVAEDEKIVIQGIIKAYLENKKD